MAPSVSGRVYSKKIYGGRACIVCGEIFYPPDKTREAICVPCKKIKKQNLIREWRKKNREKTREYQRKYSKRKKEEEKIKQNKKKIAEEKERKRVYAREYYQAVGKFKKRNRSSYLREYRLKNLDRIKNSVKKWRDKNRGRFKILQSQKRCECKIIDKWLRDGYTLDEVKERYKNYNKIFPKVYKQKKKKDNMLVIRI